MLVALPCVASAAFETPPYQPLQIEAQVPSYQVKPDLSNIVNLKQFGKFTAGQKSLLARQAFFAAPADDKQLYLVYEDNDYKVIPNFVASDAVLQLYHIFYDYSLREMEAERLIPLCQKLTQHMLAQSASTYHDLPASPVRGAALRNVAYFGVAAKALGLSADLPPEALEMVEQEWGRILKHEGRESSAIFPFSEDYSQYVPRGHYTRSEKLKRYFIAMMWYGRIPFPLEWPEGKHDYEQIRQSLLIARTLYETKLNGKPVIETWERIYEPTVFYVESADDLTPAEWRETALKVWGRLPGPAQLEDKAKLDSFYELASEMRAPGIATFPKGAVGLLDMPTGPQFRFMGQRDIPDSYMLQQLVFSYVGTTGNPRIMPLGMDVFSVLGSARAYGHLVRLGATKYARYDQQTSKLKAEFAAKRDQDWRENLYWGWLWVLRGLTTPVSAGNPSFMQSDAWLDKELNSALASWAEMRHDTILYAKQSYTAEGGGGKEPGQQPPVPKGYVEPVAEVYHRLLWLTQTTRRGLRDRDLLTTALDESFGRMEDLLAFLERVSLRELANQPLKAGEYDQIRLLGTELEGLTDMVTKAIGGQEGELISEADEDMAVVADVHTAFPDCLEEGVGHGNHIFVVVPIQGKLYLARGATFSYFEFDQAVSDRLTDEKWQAMVSSKKAPAPPTWTFSFLSDAKPEIPVPKLPRTSGGGC
jgi:hypothetical protein